MATNIFDLYFTAIHDVQTIRYSSLAATMLYFYDYLLTIDQEFELIWKHGGYSTGKILFLLNRYYALHAGILNTYVLFSPQLNDNLWVSAITLLCVSSAACAIHMLSLCKGLHWFRWQGATGTITVGLTELILQLRLYALWSLDKKVLVLMLTVFIVTLVTSAALVADGLQHITASASQIPGLPFCTRTEPHRGFNDFWLPILFSETLLCGLAVYRGFQTYYARSTTFRTRQPLLTILVRDSILYFLIVFATYVTNAAIFVKGNDTQMECAVCFAVSMASVMGNRLCLNVREMVQPKDGTTFASKATAPVFRHEMSTLASDETMTDYRETIDKPDVEVHVDVRAEGASDPNPV